jgi:hypothetical protein
MKKRVLIGAALLAGVWVLVAWLYRAAGALAQTPEKIIAYVGANPVAGRSAEEREAIVREVARRVNMLDFEQREAWREREGGLEDPLFFESLNADEQVLLIELTMDVTFKKMMEAFNKMDPQRRREIVDRALEDMEDDGRVELDRRRLEELDAGLYEKMVATGLEAFYSEANAETKMDLAPLLERMQRRMRSGR